jgi:hypothetical protein
MTESTTVQALQSLQKSLDDIIWILKAFIGIKAMNPNAVI